MACFAELSYKNMTGSSQYKFGILAKIVKYLRVSVFLVSSVFCACLYR